MGKFVIKEVKSGIKFDLKAGNGEIIATSEVYNSMESCKKGVASVQKNAPVAAVEIRQWKVMLLRSIPSLRFIRIRQESSVSA